MSEVKLTKHERRRMRTKLRQTRDVRLYRRLLAILEYDRGTSTGAIAEWLNVSRQSVYNWIARFQEHRDTAELNDAPHSGRPARADESFDTLLRVLLMLSPERFGYHATHWTVRLLRNQLQKNLGQNYSDDTIRRGLRRIGYV